ncbi:MAG: VTT domain-containing protein [Firmicutes bacterium]|nr:VTT domain-containing protein [Bacillota bacterium]
MKEFLLNYLSALGIGGILLSSFIEALGVPFFPGGIMVIVAGFLIAEGYLAFPAAWVATSSGFIAGSLIAYSLGAKLGEKVFARSGRLLGVTPARLKQARAYLSRSAPGFVIFGRFIPGISNLTPYLAGIGGLGLGLFFTLTAAFAVTWSALYLSLGMFFDENWGKLTQRMQPLLLIGSLIGLGIYLLATRQRAKKIS